MANPKPSKQNNKPQSSCSNRKQCIQKEINNGRPINICPSLKREQKISFDSADKLAEEIAALRDKKS